jgi:tyrosyl-tRNA synthetase
LAAGLHPREVAELEADITAGGKSANDAKRRVARAIAGLFHGEQAARQAEERFNSVFRDHEVPSDAAEFSWDLSEDEVHLPALMVAAGLAESASAARRLIDAGAVKIDGRPVNAKVYNVRGSDLEGRVLSVGRRKAVRVVNLPV